MSQVTTQPRIPVPTRQGPTRAACIGALLALTAAVAVALVIALGGDSTDSPAVETQVLPAMRADGGPEESGIAAAIGSQSAVAPPETAVAAAVGTGSHDPVARPDESRIAAAVSAR